MDNNDLTQYLVTKRTKNFKNIKIKLKCLCQGNHQVASQHIVNAKTANKAAQNAVETAPKNPKITLNE